MSICLIKCEMQLLNHSQTSTTCAVEIIVVLPLQQPHMRRLHSPTCRLFVPEFIQANRLTTKRPAKLPITDLLWGESISRTDGFHTLRINDEESVFMSWYFMISFSFSSWPDLHYIVICMAWSVTQNRSVMTSALSAVTVTHLHCLNRKTPLDLFS